MAVLGEKLRWVLRTTQPGLEVESRAVNLSNSVGSVWKVTAYGDRPQEAYAGRTRTSVESVHVVLVGISPAGCTSIRIATTLEYE
jgi:hypothetical protein